MSAVDAIAAKHAAERAVDEAAHLERDGELQRALDRRTSAAAELLDKVPPALRQRLAAAMQAAIGELSRAPRSDTGAVLAASAKLDGALRAVIAAGASASTAPRTA